MSAEGVSPKDGREDARERYLAAVARRARIEAEWIKLGSPVTSNGGATGRALVPHPLLKTLAEADGLCDRLERSLSRRPAAGRPTGSESAPDRVAPPRVRRLRSA